MCVAPSPCCNLVRSTPPRPSKCSPTYISRVQEGRVDEIDKRLLLRISQRVRKVHGSRVHRRPSGPARGDKGASRQRICPGARTLCRPGARSFVGKARTCPGSCHRAGGCRRRSWAPCRRCRRWCRRTASPRARTTRLRAGAARAHAHAPRAHTPGVTHNPQQMPVSPLGPRPVRGCTRRAGAPRHGNPDSAGTDARARKRARKRARAGRRSRRRSQHHEQHAGGSRTEEAQHGQHRQAAPSAQACSHRCGDVFSG